MPAPETDPIDGLRQALEARADLRLAILFGSSARDTAGPESDMDLAVLVDGEMDVERRRGLIELAADLAGRPVDLVDLATADVVTLRSVLTTGRRLVCKDRAAYERLVRQMLNDTADFLPYRERLLRERRAQWIR